MSNLYISRTEKTIDTWETPGYFFKLLDDEFHFTLDAAASKSNAKCKKFYTKETNGLIQNWSNEIVFVNPPFSDLKHWVKKGFKEGQKENTTVVMLMPSRTDTAYWQKYVLRSHEIWNCNGRVNFLKNGKKPENGCTFALSVIIFQITDNKYPITKPFHHRKKDLIKYRKLDDFCRSLDGEVRERPLINTKDGGDRQK